MSKTTTSVAAVGASMVARAERRRGPGMDVNSKAQNRDLVPLSQLRRACETLRGHEAVPWTPGVGSGLPIAPIPRGVPVSHQLRLGGHVVCESGEQL